MTERHSSRPPVPAPATGSAIPARLRIVGWILVTTGLGLLAVVLTVRSALLTDVEQAANSDVVQEIDEFRTFADRGRDPQTGLPFTTADRLLGLYLERQYPSETEVLVGYDRGAAATGTSPLIVQEVDDPFGLLDDPALVQRLVDEPRGSGSARVGEAEMRWGKAEVTVGGGRPGGVLLVTEFVGPARDEVADVVDVVLLVCLGGLVLTSAIAFVVAGQILGPVRAVHRAASRITRANLGQRIEVRGRDDVTALALTFNAMLDRLEQAFRAHRGFAATAEHFLREPLAVLADDARSAADRRAARERAGSILDDLDILADSQSPEFAVPAPVDVAALTGELVDDVRGLGSRDWAVESVATGTADLDARLVREAVRRLALNAMRQSTGTLLLGSRTDDDHLEVWVSDDGPGLTPESAERVLNRYQDLAPEADRADRTDRTDRTGPGRGVGPRPGLGLSVVRAVADAHHGSAWVETDPGRGATFGLRLPLRHEGVSRASADGPTARPAPGTSSARGPR